MAIKDNIDKDKTTRYQSRYNWSLDSLCNEVYLQLDNKLIKDEKDGRWKRKYRERAKDYIFKLPATGIEPFEIDSSDLSKRVKKELDGLDYDAEEYVEKEVVGRIFDSIGEHYLKLSVRGHLDWELTSRSEEYGSN
jgi:hypothetical protein